MAKLDDVNMMDSSDKEEFSRENIEDCENVAAEVPSSVGQFDDPMDIHQSNIEDLFDVEVFSNNVTTPDGSMLFDCLMPPADGPPDTNELMSSSITHDDVVATEVNLDVEKQKTLKDKVVQWTINNIGHIKLRAVTDLLKILHSEGHKDLPKTAKTLLGFKHRVNSKAMISKKDKVGQYVYLGIQNGLEKRIKPEIYSESVIRVIIHIDGGKMYNDTKEELWPVAVKLFHKDYECEPFIAALYYGNGKPKRVQDYLKDFVKESKYLIQHGLTINNRFYSFEIAGIVAEGRARAYLKCIKGPTGYYGCERCTVKGETVSCRRVYADMSCKKRTKKSFKKQTQQEHHPGDKNGKFVSPLLEIPNFDPVLHFPQEIMHLLFLNLTKSLMEKWTKRKKNEYKLTREKLLEFTELMNSIRQFVPEEFQRDEFAVEDAAHWKATQCSFLLLYASGIILKFVLDDDRYKHFIQLHTAVIILCNRDWAVQFTDFAEESLRCFFSLMAMFYSPESQIMHAHSVIHISDDVRTYKTSLSDLSAFWGENCIGKLKDYVIGRAKPVAQIVNRLSAIEKSDAIYVKKREIIKDLIMEKFVALYSINENEFEAVHSVTYNDLILRGQSPNNTVELTCGDIFIIQSLLMKKRSPSATSTLDNLFMEGYRVLKTRDVFKSPCPSRNVGINKIKQISATLELLSLKQVRKKCLRMTIHDRQYSVSLLHT